MSKIELYNGDCLEEMKKIPDGSVDLIICDPPYNRSVAKWDSYSTEEYLEFMNKNIKEYKRLLSESGSLFVYSQAPTGPFVFSILFNELYFLDEIIWYYKNGGGNTKKKLKNAHQNIYWFSKNNTYTRNFENVRVPYSGTRAIYTENIDKNPKKHWAPNKDGALPSNVWEFSVVRQKEATVLAKIGVQKPLGLGERMIKIASNPGDTVLIPFVGSGTECVNCKMLGRDVIGIEMDRNNFKIAKERIENA